MNKFLLERSERTVEEKMTRRQGKYNKGDTSFIYYETSTHSSNRDKHFHILVYNHPLIPSVW